MIRARRFTILSFWATLAIGLCPCANAQNPAPKYLYNLSAGTRLVALKPIFIPANQDQLLISSPSEPQIQCQLRMRKSEPFDRVLGENHSLTVKEVDRAGFTLPHRIATNTYVKLSSPAVEDILCTADRGTQDPTFAEFEKLMAGDFTIQLPRHPPVEID